MGGSAVTESRSPPPGSAVDSGAACLTIPEIMGVAQHLFSKSDFALLEEALRKRENILKAEVASTFRRQLSQLEAEKAVNKSKCEKACGELAAVLGEMKRFRGQQDAERRTWMGKEEIYKKKIAELESAPSSDLRLQAERRAWQQQEATYDRRISKLECEVKSVTKELEAERRAWLEKEETYKKKIALLDRRHTSDAPLQPECGACQEKEESYKRWIWKLEKELKSDSLGRKEAENLHLQTKNELMKMIQMLKDAEEMIVKHQKEYEELRDLKIRHEQLVEELSEAKRSEEVYEERILELENELKEKDRAATNFLEVTSAYVDLEEEKGAAERAAEEWKRKYEELEARMSRTLIHTNGSKNSFASLHPCQAGLAAEDHASEKPSGNLSQMNSAIKLECRKAPISEDDCIPDGCVIEISDSDGEGQNLKRCKRLHK